MRTRDVCERLIGERFWLPQMAGIAAEPAALNAVVTAAWVQQTAC